ncbi:uncharacterized [Tachysurus ichikawai]
MGQDAHRHFSARLPAVTMVTHRGALCTPAPRQVIQQTQIKLCRACWGDSVTTLRPPDTSIRRRVLIYHRRLHGLVKLNSEFQHGLHTVNVISSLHWCLFITLTSVLLTGPGLFRMEPLDDMMSLFGMCGDEHDSGVYTMNNLRLHPEHNL